MVREAIIIYHVRYMSIVHYLVCWLGTEHRKNKKKNKTKQKQWDWQSGVLMVSLGVGRIND